MLYGTELYGVNLDHFSDTFAVLHAKIIIHVTIVSSIMSPSVSSIMSPSVSSCYITDAPGAMEMTWLQVKPEELMEPKVTVGNDSTHITVIAHDIISD